MYGRQLEERTFPLEKIPVAGEIQTRHETLIEAVAVFLQRNSQLCTEFGVFFDVLADRASVVLFHESPIEVLGQGIEVQPGPHARDGGEIYALDFRLQPARDIDRGRLYEALQLVVVAGDCRGRSEEHTSELQSLRHLVCRL